MRRLALALLLAGCDGVSAASGAREPIRVRNAAFFGGDLPAGAGPEVLTIDSQNNLLSQGQAGKRLGGDAAKGANAIALRLGDVGTGYWILPVGAPDPQTPGALSWEAVCDFSRDLPSGRHELVVAASDDASEFGPHNSIPLLVQSLVPDAPAVVSLAWDSPADLDLRVVGPAGAIAVDRDSNAGCADGTRVESAVLPEPAPPGLYQVWVDMFAPCGAPAASFVLTVRVAGAAALTQKGRLVDLDADGGSPGLFVTEFSL